MATWFDLPVSVVQGTYVSSVSDSVRSVLVYAEIHVLHQPIAQERSASFTWSQYM